MKILITGGAGFVGSNLALYFNKKGYEVTVLDNLVRRGSEQNLNTFKEKGIKFIHGDIRCNEDLTNIGIHDVICECSAQPSAIDGYGNPYFDFSNNTIGLINVLEYARKTDSKVIFWSTNKLYSGDKINALPMVESGTRFIWDSNAWMEMSNPPQGFDPGLGIAENFSIDGGEHSIYGFSKLSSDIACQEYSRAFDVPTVINRFSCLAGERQWGKSEQGWAAWWAIAGYFDLPLTYIGWNGKQVRDVLFTKDICKLIEMEILHIDSISGEAFNIGGGMEYSLSLREATTLMEKLYNKKIKTTLDPEPRPSDQCIYISDISKVKRVLGWEPTVGIEEGYETMVKWVVDNKDILEKLYL